MKVNRWIALAAIAVVVVAAMSVVSVRAFAWINPSPAAQDCAADTGSGEANEAAETEDGNMEECDQPGEAAAAEANEAAEGNGQDQSDETAPANIGITSDEARVIVEAAHPGAATLAIEFDREGGRDIWEVELDNGLDVQVDANTGVIFHSEQRD